MEKKGFIGIVAAVLVIVLGILYFCFSYVKVTFKYNNGTDDVVVKLKRNSTVAKPKDPEYEGHEFLGWMLDDEEFDFNVEVKKNITLEANWTSAASGEVYTIEFDSKGAGNVKSIKVTNGKVSELPIVSKDGYEFDGWYNGKTKIEIGSVIDKNLKVTAKWIESKESSTTKKTTNKKTTTKKKTTSKTTTTKTTTVKPTTTEAVKMFSITFDTAGGSVIEKISVKKDGIVTEPVNPTKKGYIFDGWYLGTTKYNFDTKVTGDITLVAKWVKEPVLGYKIVDVEGSTVGEAIIYLTKDGAITDGVCDIVLITNNGNKTYAKAISKNGYRTNKYIIKEIKNIKIN